MYDDPADAPTLARDAPTLAQSGTGISRETLETVIGKTPFAKLLGASVVDFSPGRVSLRVPITRDIKQHHGVVHGAVIGFVADSACAWAAASSVGDVVTSEYKLNLLAPAFGEALIGRGEVLRISKHQVVCRADIFSVRRATERMVATTLATVARLD